MFITKKLVLASTLVALLAAGCSQDNGPLAPTPSAPPANFGYLLPEGATVASATFKIFAVGATYQSVEIYRTTADWAEMTATWNNFDLYGGSFDPAALGGFTVATGMSYYTVDVTAQVMAWMSGAQPNYGLLVKQPVELSSRTEYYSRERGTNPPVLEIVYMLDGSPYTEVLQPLADVMINAVEPNTNFGATDKLYSGWRDTGEKVSLVRFDLDVVEPELAAIGDYVWYDTNQNGIQDEGEAGVPGVTVHLTDCEGNVVDTMLTDANGYYLFDELEPGEYAIHFVLPDGYVFTLQNIGADNLDSDADPFTGETECTELVAGETDLSWDAGIFMPEQEEGCTHTIGYWKTHCGFGPQSDVVTALLGAGIWLGDADGDESLAVTTRQIAYDVLRQRVYGTPSNGITKLYAQLLGAKLSMADGAGDGAVALTIAAADAFLAMHDWHDWSSLSADQQMMVLGWHDLLDDYNNGEIGPGHCDE